MIDLAEGLESLPDFFKSWIMNTVLIPMPLEDFRRLIREEMKAVRAEDQQPKPIGILRREYGATMSSRDVAKELQISPATANAYARDGVLKATKAGRPWIFHTDDVERFLNGERKPLK